MNTAELLTAAALVALTAWTTYLIAKEHRRETTAMQPLVLLLLDTELSAATPDEIAAAADESVARVLGWADPFETTRREIAALETTEETR